MQPSGIRTPALLLLSLGLQLAVSPALANKVQKLELEAVDGLVLRVISDSGERWDRLAEGLKPRANLQLKYECRFKHKLAAGPAAEAEISVFGPLVGSWKDSLLLKGEDAILAMIPLQANAARGPAKLCNDWLGNRVIDTGKSKKHFLARGTTLKGVKLEARATLTCRKVSKGGFDDFLVRKATIPVTLQCAAYPYPGQGKGKKPQASKDDSKPLPKRAGAVKSLQLKLNPTRYTGKCPVKLQVSGSIDLDHPAEIRYQYIGDRGVKSPVFTLRKKARGGRWNLAPWTRSIEAPKTGTPGNLAAGPKDKGRQYRGWMKVRVISPKVKLSEGVAFNIRCTSKPPGRPALMQKPDSGKLPGLHAPSTSGSRSGMGVARLGAVAAARQPASRPGGIVQETISDEAEALLQWARKVRNKPALTRRPSAERAKNPKAAVDPERLVPMVRQWRRLHSEILRSDGKMSPVQASRIERKLDALVRNMDRQTGKACNGKPSKGSLAACMCDCGEAYQGWGKGKGWNRFVCKAGCLSAKTLGK